MYKVLIVDDEVLVRVGLKTTIDWEDIGFTITAEASNGEQGYEQYKKHNPDVLITDIRMPKHDGLWLIEEIRKENQDIKILVLTCYDEFSYARKALKLGADDYILKSEVEDEELITVMTEIKSKIDDHRETKNIQIRVKNNRNDMKRSLLNDLIKSGFCIDDKITERCSELEFTLFNTKFAWSSIGINEETAQNEPEANKMKDNAILNIIFDQLQDKGIEFLYNYSRNNYIFLKSSEEMSIAGMRRIFELVSNAARQYFDLPLKIIFSDPFADPRKMLVIYKDFMEKIQVLFYQEPKHGFISNIKDISFKDVNVFDLKKQYSPTFIECIGRGDSALLNKLNYGIKDYFKENRVNPMTVKIFYSTLTGDVFNSYGQFIESNEELLKYEDYHYSIVNSDSLKKVIRIFSDFAVKVINELRQARETELIINKAINYIENNYDRKISLEDIAVELNMSKPYLCNLFKQKTGETTSVYINKLRIEKAKKLLLKRDQGIKEIFEEVGFTNQYYFSKIFKKFTGMTITEYRAGKNDSAGKRKNIFS